MIPAQQRARYRTIVADPPWRYRTTLPPFAGPGHPRSKVPYATLSTQEIAALPVRDLAAADAHLYLWTTNTHMLDAGPIIAAWGFTYSTPLIWCKAPRGAGGFPTFAACTEFVLFCHRGRVDRRRQIERNWWQWPRGLHSAKPEAFLDMVETVSNGPYLEIFARRNRLGWDTWGDECLRHIDLEASG